MKCYRDNYVKINLIYLVYYLQTLKNMKIQCHFDSVRQRLMNIINYGWVKWMQDH